MLIRSLRLTKNRFMFLGLTVFAITLTFVLVSRSRARDPVVAPRARVVEKTAPPIAVLSAPQEAVNDPVVDAIALAIQEGRVTAPPANNALELILAAEKDRPGEPAIAEQRTVAVDYLLASALLLWEHGKRDSARILYQDVLRFDPSNALATERTRRDRPVATSTPASGASRERIERLIAQIDLAVIDRRFVAPPGHSALDYLLVLRKLDPSNKATSRLSGELANALDSAAKQQPEQAKELAAAAERVRGAQPIDAIVELEKKKVQESVKLSIAKGKSALSAGDYAGATAAFQRAISEDNNSHAGLAGLAEVAYNQADFQRAVLTAKRAVTLAPRSAAYRMILAKSLYKIMRYDEAIAQWQKALEIDPSNATAAKNIEMAKARSGK